MEFLAPHLLWALPLVGVPLLLYWWKHRQAPERNYPSLAWLDETIRNKFQRTKTRRWLQVLWRIALILLLIYTLSQPVIGEGEPPARDHYLFMDNSMSMEAEEAGEHLWEEGLRWIEEYRESIGSNGTVYLGRMLPEPALFGQFGPDETIDTGLFQTRPGTARISDLRRFIQSRKLPADARVILISDAQRSLFQDAGSNQSRHPVHLYTPFQTAPNHALLESSFRRSPLFRNQSAGLTWKTRPHSQQPAAVTIAGDTLYPNNPHSLTWKAEQTGQHRVTVTLPPDPLDWDNRWHTVARVREQLRIYTLGNTPAVASLVHLLGDQASTVSDIREADLVLIGTAPGQKQINPEQLPEKLPSIPRLITTGEEIDRRWLARLDGKFDLPWQIEGRIDDVEARAELARSGWFSGDKRDLVDNLSVSSYYRLQSPATQQIIVKIKENPLLARSGSWWINTLPARQFVSPDRAGIEWPEYLSEVVHKLVQEAPEPTTHVGEFYNVPNNLTYPIEVFPPAGERFILESSDMDWAPAKAGFYRLTGKQGAERLVAVNHSPGEGDLRPLPDKDWPRGIKRLKTAQLDRFHLSLTPWLWLALLLGLGVDIWLGNRLERN